MLAVQMCSLIRSVSACNPLPTSCNCNTSVDKVAVAVQARSICGVSATCSNMVAWIAANDLQLRTWRAADDILIQRGYEVGDGLVPHKYTDDNKVRPSAFSSTEGISLLRGFAKEFAETAARPNIFNQTMFINVWRTAKPKARNGNSNGDIIIMALYGYGAGPTLGYESEYETGDESAESGETPRWQPREEAWCPGAVGLVMAYGGAVVIAEPELLQDALQHGAQLITRAGTNFEQMAVIFRTKKYTDDNGRRRARLAFKNFASWFGQLEGTERKMLLVAGYDSTWRGFSLRINNSGGSHRTITHTVVCQRESVVFCQFRQAWARSAGDSTAHAREQSGVSGGQVSQPEFCSMFVKMHVLLTFP